MAGVAKLTPMKTFQDNIADTERLVAYARALTNQRAYRFRKELRSALAAALKIANKDEDGLGGLESSDLFVVFKPGSGSSVSC